MWASIREFINKNQTVGILTAILACTLLSQLTAYFALYATGRVELYARMVQLLVLPTHIKDLIFQPWSILTWVFFTSGFEILYLATALLMFWVFGKLHQQLLGDFRTRRMILLGVPTLALVTVISSSFFPFKEVVNPLELGVQTIPAPQNDVTAIAGERGDLEILGQEGAQVVETPQAKASIGVSRDFLFPSTFMAIAFMLMTACIGLVPDYPVHMFPGFSLKIVWAGVINLLIQVFWSGWSPATIAILAGGGLGLFHIYLLKRGTDLTDLVWSYYQDKSPRPRMKVKHGGLKQDDYPEHRTAPTPLQTISQEAIDQILDKISEKGYNSLSREEKELLFRASSQEENGKK